MVGPVSRSLFGARDLRPGKSSDDATLQPKSVEAPVSRRKRSSRQRAAKATRVAREAIPEAAPQDEAPWVDSLDDSALVALAAARGLQIHASALDQLCVTYGLGRRLACQALDGSGATLRLLLTTERGDYELRAIARDVVGRRGLDVELGLIAYLRQRSFPAPNPLSRPSGGQYVRHEGVFYVIAPAMAGQAYDESDAQAIAAGRSLARYHTLVRDYPGPFRLAGSRYLTDVLVEDAAWLRGMQHFVTQVRPDQLGELGEVFSDVSRQLLDLQAPIRDLYGKEPRLITHGSFTRGAVLFHDDVVVKVDDFEQTSYDVRLTDVARACISFCRHADGSAEGPALERGLYRQFRAAYAEGATLNERESRCLPVFIQAERIFGFVAQCRALFDASSPDETGGLVDSITGSAENLRSRMEVDADCIGED